MWQTSLSLLTLIVGLLVGFYGRQVLDRLNVLVEARREANLARQVGVVHPMRIPAERNAPIDLSSETGGVMRPTPAGAEEARKKQRDDVLQENHR